MAGDSLDTRPPTGQGNDAGSIRLPLTFTIRSSRASWPGFLVSVFRSQLVIVAGCMNCASICFRA